MWRANGPLSGFVVVFTKCLSLPVVSLVLFAQKARGQCDLVIDPSSPDQLPETTQYHILT